MIKDEHKVIILAIIPGLAFWLADTIMDNLIFYKMPFLDLLIFNVPSHEIYIRVFAGLCFVLFSLVISRYIARANESESRYRQLFDNMNDAVFVISADKENKIDRFLEVNDEACKRLGYTREELLKLSIPNINSFEDVPQIPGRFERLLADKHVLFETVHVAHDGHRIPVEVNAHLVDFRGRPASLAIARDITARHQAQEALQKAHEELEQRVLERTAELMEVNRQLLLEMAEHRQTAEKLQESEERFRTLFQTAGSVIILIATDGRILEFNAEAERVFGWSRLEVLEKNAIELLVPEMARELAQAGKQKILNGLVARGREFTLRLRDGTERVFLWNVNPLHDGQGRIAGIVSVGHDITERKLAEEAVKNERQRLFSLLDGLPAYIGLYAPDFSCKFVNQLFRDRFGDPGGTPCYEFLHGCKTLCETCPTFRAFQDQTPQEFEWTTADGRTYQLYDYPFADIDGSPAVLEMGIDITTRKQAEEALKKSEQKLHHLATRFLTIQEDERRRLSQELHEEMGQTLLAMKLRLSVIKEKLQSGKQVRQQSFVGDCDRLSQYLQDMVDNIRRLSRDLSPAILVDLGLPAAIKNLCEEFCKHHENIQSCSCNVDEIHGVLPKQDQVNIYRIVQESLDNIGKHSDATQLWLAITKQEDRISFELEDNGKGFDPDNFRSPAIGLGLATLEERVRILGGTLRLESKKSEGTRVRFDIPLKERGQGSGVRD
jgi:PAS domain S-box-containing protein